MTTRVNEDVKDLEFDDHGTITINLEDRIMIVLERKSGTTVAGESFRVSVLDDYDLTNTYSSQGRSFLPWLNALKRIKTSYVKFKIRVGYFHDYEKPTINLNLGSNNLELIIYDTKNPGIQRSEFVNIRLDGRIHRVNGYQINLVDDAVNLSNEYLEELVEIARMLESNIGGSKPIKHFNISSNRFGNSHVNSFGKPDPYFNVVYYGEIDEHSVKETFTHEKSHGFYDEILKNGGHSDIRHFEIFFNENNKNGKFGVTKFDEISRGKRRVGYDPNYSVFGIFIEGYYHNMDEGIGHPYDNSNELFASVTTVMTTYPDELIEKILRLPTQESKDLAKEVMSRVVGLFEKYNKTGTQLFLQQILDYAK